MAGASRKQRTPWGDNITKGVHYHYIVGPKFNPAKILSVFRAPKKYLKTVEVTHVPSLHFKTFFTLHFNHVGASEPTEIFMSALLRNRDDLLIQVTDKEHQERIFRRVEALVGRQQRVEDISTRNFVHDDAK